MGQLVLLFFNIKACSIVKYDYHDEQTDPIPKRFKVN